MNLMSPKFLSISSLVLAGLVIYHIVVINQTKTRIVELEKSNLALSVTNDMLTTENGRFDKLTSDQKKSIDSFISANLEASKAAEKALNLAQKSRASTDKSIQQLVNQTPSGSEYDDCLAAKSNLSQYFGAK